MTGEFANLFGDFFYRNFATDGSASLSNYAYLINDHIDVQKVVISHQDVL